MQEIFANTDSEKLVERALPKKNVGLTPSQLSRARSMLNRDNPPTQAEVAAALGVSVTTLTRSLQ